MRMMPNGLPALVVRLSTLLIMPPMVRRIFLSEMSTSSMVLILVSRSLLRRVRTASSGWPEV